MSHTALRISPALLLVLASACAALAQEPATTFDLKTRFAEKYALAPAKNGALLILMESEWGSVTEFGEDYALWLGNLRREQRGDSIHLTLDVELRTASLFAEGDLLKSRSVTVAYDIHDDWKSKGSQAAVNVLRKGEACVQVALAAGELIYPAVTHAVERIVSGLETLMPQDYGEMKLEAMVTGAEVVAAARAMTGEIAAAKNAPAAPSLDLSPAHKDAPATSPSDGAGSVPGVPGGG